MIINGAHAVIFSAHADADRDFLRDVVGLPHVDVGDGWLIFGLPPSEIAVHPAEETAEENGRHEIYLMCDDVEALVDVVTELGVRCGAVEDMGWGRLVELTLPGGGALGVYEPRHQRPESPPI